MSDRVSANTDDLDSFVEHGRSVQQPLRATFEALARQRQYLLSVGLPFVVERSAIDGMGETLHNMASLDQFVDDISSSLKRSGEELSQGVLTASSSRIVFDAKSFEHAGSRSVEAGPVGQQPTIPPDFVERAEKSMSWLGVPSLSLAIDLPELPSFSVPSQVADEIDYVVDHVVDDASGVVDGVKGRVSDVYGDFSDGAGELYDSGRDRAAGVINEGLGLGFTFGEYLTYAKHRRQQQGTSQSGFDALFEDGAAALGILGMGGELYKGDVDGYCDGQHSCIVGVSTPLGGAVTLGHTVLYTSDIPDAEIIGHEQQHVYQYEEFGAAGFLSRWVASSAVDVAFGGDGYLDTEHEREGYYVQDYYNDPTSPARPAPDLDVPDPYFPSDGRPGGVLRPDGVAQVWEGGDVARERASVVSKVIWASDRGEAKQAIAESCDIQNGVEFVGHVRQEAVAGASDLVGDVDETIDEVKDVLGRFGGTVWL